MLNRNPSARTAAQESTKSSLLFRPAQFLAILMLAAGLLFSCEPTSKDGAKSDTKYSSMSFDVKVITVDSCEYIVAQTGTLDGGLSIVHKQNCKYCLNRKK